MLILIDHANVDSIKKTLEYLPIDGVTTNPTILYREGKEEREIFCDCLKDWNTFEMVWVEAEPPYAEVQRRPMTPEEKQPSLLDYDHKPESAEVAKAAKALEREPAECLEVQ